MNKTIYLFNNNLYKINKRTNNNIFLSSLNIDNELEFNIMKTMTKTDDSIKYYYKKYKFPVDKYVHFTSEIQNDMKIKRVPHHKFKNYKIIDDVDDIYLYNNELKYNYRTSIFLNTPEILKIQYELYCDMLYFNNEDIKINFGHFRRYKISFFQMNIENNDKYLDIIKSIGYYDIYLSIKEEYINYIHKNIKIAFCECPVCLSDEIKVYTNFYRCSHPICYECYNKWSNTNKNASCPLCRANER